MGLGLFFFFIFQEFFIEIQSWEEQGVFLADRAVSSPPSNTGININYIVRPHPPSERWGGVGQPRHSAQGACPSWHDLPAGSSRPQFVHLHAKGQTSPSACPGCREARTVKHATQSTGVSVVICWSVWPSVVWWPRQQGAGPRVPLQWLSPHRPHRP